MSFSSRKIAEGLYGGHLPRDVAAAVALGILCGAITGSNLSCAALLLVAILFNIHTRLFLAAWLASLLLAWLARGCLENLGRFVLDGTPLAHALGELGDGALVALLGWDQYALVGGLAGGSVLAVACAWLTLKLTRRLNRRWSDICAAAEANKVAEPVSDPPRRDRALVCVWFGPTEHERSLRRTMTSQRLRRCGVPAAMAAALALAILPWWLAGRLAERELFRQLSASNGAEVTSGHTQLSLWGGNFVLRDVQVADPQHLDRDRLRIGLAKGRLSPGLLLRGHLDIEKLVVQQVRADVARRRAARACGVLAAPAARDLVDASQPAGAIEVSSALGSWKSVCRSLVALQQLVVAIEQLSRAEDAGELSTSTRSQLGTRRPWIVVRQMRAFDLESGWNLGRKSLIELTDLSSDPALSKRAPQLKVVLPQFGAEVLLDLAVNNPGQPHALRCSACDLELAHLLDLTDGRSAVSLEVGRARLSGEGSFDQRQLDVRLLVDAESLAVNIVGNRALLGIEPTLWNNGLKRLGGFHAEVALTGRWSSPSLGIDANQLVEQFKQRLRAAGELDLVAAVEQQRALYETAKADSQVMQAAATEPQMTASRPGLCEFSEDGPPELTVREEYEAMADGVDEALRQAMQYPTTSIPYDDSNDEPPVSPPLVEVTPIQRRRLPGPVNMVVGREPYAGFASSVTTGAVIPHAEPRESFLSRWTQGLRQKLGQAFSKPEPAEEEPGEQVDRELNLSEERSIPAAASEAWYNRRWR